MRLGEVTLKSLSVGQGQRPRLVFDPSNLLLQAKGWDDTIKYDLYKADFTDQEWLGLRSNVMPSIDSTAKLHNFDVVDDIWPDGFPRANVDFIVVMKQGMSPSSSAIELRMTHHNRHIFGRVQ